MSETNNTLKYRVGRLEEAVKDISDDVTNIKDNHLHGIRTAISALDKKVEVSNTEIKTRVNVTTVLNVAAIILGIIIVKIFNLL